MDNPIDSTSSTPAGRPAERPGISPLADLMNAMYQHAPMLVVLMTVDGTVLHCNPATCMLTGFAESELIGKNFWGMLFPGRLFAQVPRFVSTLHPAQVLGQDTAMTLRTRCGKERTIAFTRAIHEAAGDVKTVLCFGMDLTDRLLQSDLPQLPGPADAQAAAGMFGTSVGNAGTVEGEVITPLAISPPVLPQEVANSPSIRQVHEFLTEVDRRMEALATAFSQGELTDLASIAGHLRDGAHACGLLDLSTRAERLHVAATSGALEQVSGLMRQIVMMCRPGGAKFE